MPEPSRKDYIELLRTIRPMAAWESCMYTNRFNYYQRENGVTPMFADDDPNINASTHCCDWSEVVERIDQILDEQENSDE